MNDDHDPGHDHDHDQDPELDPPEEERIRALLAELRTAPDASAVPPEVAARLDETLAGLVAERSDGAESQSPGGTVVPLRRRWATRATAAAAAVIVLGAGGVAAANLGLFDGSADESSTAGAGSTAESLQDSSTPPAAPDARTGQVPALSAAGFDSEVARLVRAGSGARSFDLGKSNRLQKGATADSSGATACPGPPVTGGSRPLPVLYDGTRAVLLVHPARGGERLVEAWTCAGDRVLDRTRVAVAGAGRGQNGPGSTGLASPSPSPQD